MDSPDRDDHWAYVQEMLEEISLSQRSRPASGGSLRDSGGL